MNRPFNLRCGYNTRNKMRWVIITDLNNTPVLTQTFLKLGKQCELNFTADKYDLSFMLTLKKIDSTKEILENYDYLNWADDFDLFFVGSSQKFQEKLRLNRREVYVGG